MITGTFNSNSPLLPQELTTPLEIAAWYESNFLRNVDAVSRLPGDFTFDNGALTFTMKLKRRVVEEQYHRIIESLYADVAEPRPVIQEN